MKLLELFCGTKSVSKNFKNLSLIHSLDIDPKFNPTFCIDILKFDYKSIKPNTYDFIWASPPCTEFSRAKTVGIRNLQLANKIVRRTINIIKYLKPKYFVIENPVGLLRHQSYMKPLEKYRNTVSYCKYGYIYKKDTDLWTNIKFKPKICRNGSRCKHYMNGVHPATVQQSYSSKSKTPGTPNLEQRYSIPKLLIKNLIKHI